MNIKYIIILLVFLLLLFSCQIKENEKQIKIATDNQIISLNPGYAYNTTEGAVSEILYLSLFQHKWDNQSGKIKTQTALAKNYEIKNNNIFIQIDSNNHWSDGISITTDDILFSYSFYSSKLANTKWFNTFDMFFLDSLNQIDLEKTFVVIDKYNLLINFPNKNPSIFFIDHPILPKHLFDNLSLDSISSLPLSFYSVFSGNYSIKQNSTSSNLTLLGKKIDKTSEVLDINLVYVSEYFNKFLMTKDKKFDLVLGIKPEDISKIDTVFYRIDIVKGRNYDYLGFNLNNDVFPFSKKYFRHAIDKKRIISNFLFGFAEIYSSPIPPVIKNYYDSTLNNYQYDPLLSLKILTENGFTYTDNILKFNGNTIEITIEIPGENPLRNIIAELIRDDLSKIGIETEIISHEFGTYVDNLFEGKMLIWLGGWTIPIPLDLSSYWKTKTTDYSLNFSGFSNKSVDSLLSIIDNRNNDELISEYLAVQKILNEELPFIFLYWVDEPIIINKDLKNVKISPLGVIRQTPDWTF